MERRERCAQKRVDTVPMPRPLWCDQASAYLHDANRNLTPISWAMLGTLRCFIALDMDHPYRTKGLMRVPHKPLRELVGLIRQWSQLEKQILQMTGKNLLSDRDLASISLKARQMLAIAEKIRVQALFAEPLFDEEDKTYYRRYLDTRHLVAASLRPLIEQRPRHFAERHAVDLQRFIDKYSARIFIDREGRTVQPVFRIVNPMQIKVNLDVLTASLDNLIQDAINHNPPAPIYVEVVSDEQGWVTIRVYNPGPAIPEEQLPLIGYKAYWSAAKGRLRGRGKVSVRLFCEDHGGRFKVYNRLQAGRVFGPCLEMILPAA